MIFTKLIKLHYWPAITCVWFILTFIITYFVSVHYGHVYPYFPFISDTGSTPPESCIFGQMLNIGAVLFGIITYVRYQQVKFAIKSDNLLLNKRWNILGAVCGTLASLGVTIVANFQETAILVVHAIGAIMLFGSGALFLLIQTRITFASRHIYKKNPNYWIGPNTLLIRIIVTICFCLLYLLLVTFGLAAFLQFRGETIIYWTEDDGGYYAHLVATISEWISVFIIFVYICTFTPEFKSLEYVSVRFNNNPHSNKQDVTQPKMDFNGGSYL